MRKYRVPFRRGSPPCVSAKSVEMDSRISVVSNSLSRSAAPAVELLPGHAPATTASEKRRGQVGLEAVAYSYDNSASSANNHARLDYMTYPNARTLYSRYDKHSDSGSTLEDEISDGFGRVTQFSNTNSDPGDVYIQYSHIGSGRLSGSDCGVRTARTTPSTTSWCATSPGTHSAVPTGLNWLNRSSSIPALKCRAIVNRPAGAVRTRSPRPKHPRRMCHAPVRRHETMRCLPGADGVGTTAAERQSAAAPRAKEHVPGRYAPWP